MSLRILEIDSEMMQRESLQILIDHRIQHQVHLLLYLVNPHFLFLIVQQTERMLYHNGEYPVALTGRVYCWADASNGPIRPGELLTTSNNPGHAMKVTDFGRAHGAIIGKVDMVGSYPRALYLDLFGDDNKEDPFAEGPYCFRLENPVAFERPIPLRGMQKIYNVPDELLAANGVAV